MNFNEDVNFSALAVQGGTAAMMAAYLDKVIYDATPFFVCSAALILADLYFGVRAARKRGERVRVSKAMRRTVGKAFEYFCWVMLSATLQTTFGVKRIEYVILGAVMIMELSSIVQNWLYLRGKSVRGLDAFLLKLLGRKTGADLTDIKIEDVEDVYQIDEDMNGRHISRRGLALIKEFEGFRAEAYLCPGGVWTIGYGHTGGVKKGDRTDRAEAEAFLLGDIASAERAVRLAVSRAEIGQNQFDALVSFAFNVGGRAFSSSTLCRKVNDDPEDVTIRDEFLKWVNVRDSAGVLMKSEGLRSRRSKEAELYFMKDGTGR